jgi:hypothetical protein
MTADDPVWSAADHTLENHFGGKTPADAMRPNAVPAVSQKRLLKRSSKSRNLMRFERIDAHWLCPYLDGEPETGTATRRRDGGYLEQCGAWFLFLPRPTALIPIRSQWPSPNLH